MSDRIPISSLCLFACTLQYAALAFARQGQGQQLHVVSAVMFGYALFSYFVMGVLAIFLLRWAWQISNVLFVLHLLATLALVGGAVERGWIGLLSLAAWVVMGALGLSANQHNGSRAALPPARAGVV